MPRGILSAGWHRLWFATHFLGNKDEFTVNFRGSAISHQKQVMGDLLQYAKEFNMWTENQARWWGYRQTITHRQTMLLPLLSNSQALKQFTLLLCSLISEYTLPVRLKIGQMMNMFQYLFLSNTVRGYIKYKSLKNLNAWNN